MSNDLKKAIEGLDPENDDHWTTAGLPSVEAVSEAHGEKVTRADINEAAPGFDRDQARGGNRQNSEPGQGVDAETDAGGNRPEGPIDIAGENIAGDPALNDRGGLGERPMESTAERDSRASAQSSRAGAILADRLDSDQPDGDPFDLMNRFVSITAGPRYKRNQTFAQIRTLWAQAQAGAREFQERVDKRNAMRAERREDEAAD